MRASWLLIAGMAAGCVDHSPAPRRVATPMVNEPSAMRDRDPSRPLPPPDRWQEPPPPPFEDAPLVNQRVPEAAAFTQAYDRVGRPKIVVFVNRTLEGKTVPVNDDNPIASAEYRRSADSAVKVETRDAYRGRNTFETKGPGEYRESLDIFLPKGSYDEAQARALDYEAFENTLTDWISADGAVTMISPTMARQRLTDAQVKELQDGRPAALSELAQQLSADILIQVQARPTQQTAEGLKVRVLAEAINTKGGQSVGRAFVDVVLPLDKPTINRYTRFLARKLMDGMTGAWSGPPPAENRMPAAPAGGPGGTESPSNANPSSAAPLNVPPPVTTPATPVVPSTTVPTTVVPVKPPVPSVPAVTPPQN